MTATEEYIQARDERIREYQKDKSMEVAVKGFTEHLVRANYVKNFTWMDVPILQYPTDLMAMQEILTEVKPDIVIETGIAFGGMTKFYSTILDSVSPEATLISIDVDIRKHTRTALRKGIMPIGRHILLEASSVEPKTMIIIQTIYDELISNTEDYDPSFDKPVVLVSLDSCHTHSHVLQELNLYAPLVSVGSYIVVFDTAIEFFGHLDENKDARPWGPGNSPYTAVMEFMKNNDDFIIDREIEQRILITSAPSGWLKRIK